MGIELAGRVAIITGAARGIGLALAARAAREGMIVHGWDVLPPEHTVDGVRFTRVDVASPDEIQAAAKAVIAGGSEIGLVAANAGLLRTGRSWEISPEDWQRLLAVNVGGVAAMLSAFVPALLVQRCRSHIVLTGSQSAFSARPGNAAYSASKHAVWGLAESLKLELDAAQAPVGVSLLAPGPVSTHLADANPVFRQALHDIGLAPSDIAEATFAAIHADRFWIFTHEDFKADLSARIARLMSGLPPA